ncbi:carboxymuconolactone decarboxylase family protein [Polymorphum gilvum]|uniref:Carboxymuconolactone decarboxylase family protein n=1 Tax=Polymorphum gilvum (strain LMG 25793 / CGMCC 1.9160 / SL003B-26A1) TaxID=991905 RepID=F2IVE1_POLGS|nr:carboxymuconolactone decarboxylase family protein [Polymorphum gilvum]ADZ72659.1 Carboxymuconolactone decarboxylase family protein [Polymorphum gilvum SL003B-26A1]
MAVSDWQSFIEQTDGRMADLRGGIPAVTKGFHELARAAIQPGVLDSKTKELIALAIGIAARCDGCLAYHTKAAAKYGATREEVMETIGVAVYMGGGPSMIYGAEALAAFDAFTAKS